jgi:hypothetical protein
MHRHLSLSSPGAALPDNKSQRIVAGGLLAAHRLFRASGRALPAAVVMVVQPGESNSIDQRSLEHELGRSGVRVLRRTLGELAAFGLEGGDFVLPDDGGAQAAASVVYYRAGYTPDDYPGEPQWAARAALEESSAVKCPDVFAHLFGAKKVQQALATPELRKLCGSVEEEEGARGLMTGLWPLGEEGDGGTVEMALADPGGYVRVRGKPSERGGGRERNKGSVLMRAFFLGGSRAASSGCRGETPRTPPTAGEVALVPARLQNLHARPPELARTWPPPTNFLCAHFARRYVLKPQREGGGNNLYGEEMVAALRRMSRVRSASAGGASEKEERSQSHGRR